MFFICTLDTCRSTIYYVPRCSASDLHRLGMDFPVVQVAVVVRVVAVQVAVVVVVRVVAVQVVVVVVVHVVAVRVVVAVVVHVVAVQVAVQLVRAAIVAVLPRHILFRGLRPFEPLYKESKGSQAVLSLLQTILLSILFYL